MRQERPDGWLVLIMVALGFVLLGLLGIAALVFVICSTAPKAHAYSINEEPIPLEEMLEHDLAFKYAVWEYQQIEEETKYLIDVTEEDIALMVRVVMSEVGGKDLDCKQAVAQTIVNRVRDGRWGNTVSQVVNFPNAYSTADNGEPNQECHDAVMQALTYEVFPKDMFYFRENHYHNFGYPYLHLGSTYFSTEKAAWD